MMPDYLVHDEFLQLAEMYPELLAVNSEGKSWTYGQIECASRRAAIDLLQQGVATGDVVVINCDRGAALVILLVAVVRIGAVFMILSEDCPPGYARKILRPLKKFHWLASGPYCYQRATVEEFGDGRLSGFVKFGFSDLVRYSKWKGGADEELPELGRGEDVPMYLAATSGSTGSPKLIKGTHAPVRHFIEWYRGRFEFSSSDRFSLLSGLGYDPMLRDVFTPLSCGGSLWIPSRDDIQGRYGLTRWLGREGITAIHSTPALARIMFENAQSVSLSAVRTIALGGAALLWRTALQIAEAASKSTIVSFYGATETPQAVAYHIVDRSTCGEETASFDEFVPLGRPVDGFELLVLDERDRACEPGQVGEICVVTPFLTKGYYGDEQATARSFVPVQTGGRPGTMYRTGDFGRFRHDGELHFTGRKDRQVKCRGHRVQAEEVEATIARADGVRQVAVIPEAKADRDSRLVCYLESKYSERSIVANVKRRVLTALPTYMLPEEFVVVDAMPLTTRGKVDLDSLSSMHRGKRAQPVGAELRSPAVQDKILRMWASILDIVPDALSVDSNFFEVGGNSLTVGKLVTELGNTFGKKLEITDIFLYPNVRELASFVTADETIPDSESLHETRSNSRLDRIMAIRARRMGRHR